MNICEEVLPFKSCSLQKPKFICERADETTYSIIGFHQTLGRGWWSAGVVISPHWGPVRCWCLVWVDKDKSFIGACEIFGIKISAGSAPCGVSSCLNYSGFMDFCFWNNSPNRRWNVHVDISPVYCIVCILTPYTSKTSPLLSPSLE